MDEFAQKANLDKNLPNFATHSIQITQTLPKNANFHVAISEKMINFRPQPQFS
jgi:hypothetical protein